MIKESKNLNKELAFLNETFLTLLSLTFVRSVNDFGLVSHYVKRICLPWGVNDIIYYFLGALELAYFENICNK